MAVRRTPLALLALTAGLALTGVTVQAAGAASPSPATKPPASTTTTTMKKKVARTHPLAAKAPKHKKATGHSKPSTHK